METADVTRFDPLSTRFRVLDTGINAITLDQTVDAIAEWIRAECRESLLECSVNDVLACHDSSELTQIVNSAGLAVPDGMPLVWLGRLRGYKVERVYGPDLMLAVCQYGESRGYRHFFYGGTPDILRKLGDDLRRLFPGIMIAGHLAPPFRPLDDDEKASVAKTINAAQPHIVWVGLGAPKQNYWVGEFRPLLEASVLIAVGAAFNFIAGTVRQAPRWMMRCGLEWLFRLVTEPRRLWKRYLIGNPRFVFLVLRQLLTGRGPV